jgi:hypothetical protein
MKPNAVFHFFTVVLICLFVVVPSRIVAKTRQWDDYLVPFGEIVHYLSEQVRRATRNAQSPNFAGRFDPVLTVGKEIF